MFKGIKSWAQARLAIVCLKMFTFLYARPWTGVQHVVHEEAKRIGRQLLKSWLDYHRIQHCARCMELGQLRKTIIIENEQQVYLCAKCHDAGTAAKAIRPALEIIKP